MTNKSKKLRILITLESYPPQIAGSGIATKRLAKGLCRRGHHVEIICPGDSLRYSKTLEEDITVHRVGSIAIPFHSEFRCSFFPAVIMNKLFDRIRPDILHIADHLFISRAAHDAARKNGIKVIGTNHFTPYNWIPTLGVKDRPVLYRVVEKILWSHFAALFSKLDEVTTPTGFAADMIKDLSTKKPVKIISNGMDLGRFSKIKIDNKQLEKYDIDPSEKIVLSVSRLDKEKRVDVIIEALSRIKDQVSFKAIVTGKGNEQERLKKMTEEKKLSERVIFTGVVPEEILGLFFKVSHIFITASEVELQGLSIMEAMTAGLPVLAARSMAIPELVRDGYNGFLFRPGDAVEVGIGLLKLLNDSSLLKKMSQNSLNLIKDHDIENILDSFEDIYYKNIQ